MRNPVAGQAPSPDFFERMYREWNRPEFVHPDPLEFVLRFEDPADQEVAGLAASSLAFGKVGHILKSLEVVFRVISSPAADLEKMSRPELRDALGSFRHRWVSGEELADLLFGAGRIRRDHGSLGNFFRSQIREKDRDVLGPLAGFAAGLRKASGRAGSSLLPCPSKGSACKRQMLYLRWMVRKDDVDPGPWSGVSPALLIVPMDTHMFRFARAYGLTRRGAADLKAAIDLTRFFRTIAPGDPVRYDFALTRPGIRGEVNTSIWTA